MVPKLAVTLEVPAFVSVNPLGSLSRTKLMELATVTVTAMLAEAEVASRHCGANIETKGKSRSNCLFRMVLT